MYPLTLTTFRGAAFFAGCWAGSVSPGGATAAVASLMRLASTTPPQPRRGQVPRQVTRPLVAVVLTTWLHFGHVPWTFSSAIHPPGWLYRTDTCTNPHRSREDGVSPMATAERLRRLAAAARTSRDVYRTDVEARDAEIEQADVEGMGTREIARAAELSPGHVQRIIAARTAERQASL